MAAFCSSLPLSFRSVSSIAATCSPNAPCTCRRRRSRPVLNTAHRVLSMQSDNPSSSSQKGDAPDGSTLTGALEFSFRSVWIRLLTSGIGKEYDDAITAFIIATMAAYKAGYSINALKFELAAHERITEFNGIDISLTDEEKQTRLIWISLIYLTLATTKMVTERPVNLVRDDLKGTPLEMIVPGLAALVDSVREAERKGYNLETFKMEMALNQTSGSTRAEQSEEEIRKARAQANIRSQWSRIVFRTLSVLPEDLKR